MCLTAPHLQENARINRIADQGAVAQLGERRVRNAKVVSSILIRSTSSIIPLHLHRRMLCQRALSFLSSSSKA